MKTLVHLVLILLAATASAGEADVLDVAVEKTAAGMLSFSVTVKHADTGWDHYADRWEIVGPDNTIYGSRTLYHPHEDEQPFTRSLTNVAVPAMVHQVSVRAHCSVHGYGGRQTTVPLPERQER